MRVLITNLFLANNSGSEVVVELLADGLRRAGHQPMILAPTLGPQADRMRVRGHIIVDHVAALPAAPDIIHAQHISVALAAMAAFPETPAVFACHSAYFEVEAPRPHPQIRRWIAVDDLCRDRCLSRGVPADRLTVIPNAVDLERFARRSPLPVRPQRALLLTKNAEHIDAIRAACSDHGIDLTELGPAFGRVDHEIERELPNHDIVFATARMALEAATVGCSVVVGDGRGFAGMLTSDRLSEWRRLNFGAGLLARPATRQSVTDAIASYNADDASRVTDRLRAEASLTDCVDQHLAVYNAALSDPKPDAREIAAGSASWIEDLVPASRGRTWEIIAREQFGLEAETTTAALAASEQRVTQEMSRLAAEGARRIVHELGERSSTETAEIAKLATNLNRGLSSVGGQVAELAARTASIDSRLGELASKAASLGDQVEQARQATIRVENASRGTFYGKAWRATVPHAIRAPLFKLRQRLLGRKAP